jgi:caa(3)-type oxidase subunit IV
VKVEAREAARLPFVIAWLVLLLLAGISVLSAFLGLGVWAPVVQFGIAAIQAAIVAILFMRLKGPPSLKWIFAGTGIFWLMFLFGLSMTDYTTRDGWPSIEPGPVRGSYHSSASQ